MPPKYRSNVEDRIASYAQALASEEHDEKFALTAQHVAKSALVLASAATAFSEACLSASTAVGKDGGQTQRIDRFYTWVSTVVQEKFDGELAETIELVCLVGSRLAEQEEQRKSIRRWASSLGLSTDDVAIDREEAEGSVRRRRAV